MSKRLLIALEEPLEVEKLLEAQKAANQGNEFDLTYQDKVNDEKAKEEPIEEEIGETDGGISDSEENASEDDSDASEDTESDTQPETDQKTAQEEIKNVYDLTISQEDITSDNVIDGVKKVAGVTFSIAGKAVELSIDVARHLSHLGVTYGPGILANVKKGLLFLMAKISKFLFTSITSIDRYITTYRNSSKKLSEKVISFKKSLESISTESELSNQYTDQRVINTLKIGISTDTLNNLKVLEKFLSGVIGQLHEQIQDEVHITKIIIAQYSQGNNNAPLELIKKTKLKLNLKQGTVKGYETNNQNIIPYYYGEVLPGDLNFIAHLPNTEISDLDDLKSAYHNAKIMFGVNVDSFKTVEAIDYMTKEQLTDLANTLDNLVKICQSHEKVYESIKKEKLKLRFSFKLFFQHLMTSKEKVSVKDSLLEYIELKSLITDKVYLTAAMDVHDYTSKVINSVLTFANKNLKQF